MTIDRFLKFAAFAAAGVSIAFLSVIPGCEDRTAPNTTDAPKSTRITITLTSKKIDGKSPTKMYFYGGFVKRGDTREDMHAEWYQPQPNWGALGCQVDNSVELTCTVDVPEGYDLRGDAFEQRDGQTFNACDNTTPQATMKMTATVDGTKRRWVTAKRKDGSVTNCQVGPGSQPAA